MPCVLVAGLAGAIARLEQAGGLGTRARASMLSVNSRLQRMQRLDLARPLWNLPSNRSSGGQRARFARICSACVRHRTDKQPTRVNTSILAMNHCGGTNVRSVRMRSNQDIPAIEPQPLKVWSTACRSLTGVRHEEEAMSMNRDQVKGRLKEAKGKIKEAAGKLVGNEKLEQKGKAQKVLGEAQAKFGDVKKDVKDSIKSV